MLQRPCVFVGMHSLVKILISDLMAAGIVARVGINGTGRGITVRTSVGLMGLPAPVIGYDGMIQAGMQKIQVLDGVLKIGGRRFHVSEQGQVTDEQDRPVAQIQNGKLVPLQQQQAQQRAA